jgi:hypothetical protein
VCGGIWDRRRRGRGEQLSHISVPSGLSMCVEKREDEKSETAVDGSSKGGPAHAQIAHLRMPVRWSKTGEHASKHLTEKHATPSFSSACERRTALARMKHRNTNKSARNLLAAEPRTNCERDWAGMVGGAVDAAGRLGAGRAPLGTPERCVRLKKTGAREEQKQRDTRKWKRRRRRPCHGPADLHAEPQQGHL